MSLVLNPINGKFDMVNKFRTTPYTTNVYTQQISPLVQATIPFSGVNFTPDTTIIIPLFDGTIDNVNIISPTELELTVTPGSTQTTYDIIISNKGFLNTAWTGNGAGLLKVELSDWTDLRAGGVTVTDGNGAGNDIRYHSSMSMVRDAGGMQFNGLNPWSSWVKFEFMGWTRGEQKTLQWIFTPMTSSIMIGIGSDATNETVTSQYNQAEVMAYFSSPTNLYGLYGNNGTVGSTGNQSNSYIIPASVALKIKFTDDGEAGTGVFTLYQLPSTNPADWDDEATILKTFTVGGTLAPDEPNLMPFIIPRTLSSQRFIAVRLS